MWDFLTGWMPWIGVGGVFTYAAIAILAPSALQVATPILVAGINGVTTYIKSLWEGFMDMVDNANSLVFVLSVAAIAYMFGVLDRPEPKVVYRDKPAVTQSQKKPTSNVKKEDGFDYINPLEWFR